MTKQAIGMFSLKAHLRVDTVAHILHYPQVPLVQTSMQALSPCARMPGGANVIVAVLSYTGFNQEDSVIMSQDALERGLFRSTIYKSYKDEEKGIGSDVEKFGIVPSTATGFRKADYSKVEADGLPRLGQQVYAGDVIIGKRMQTSQLGTDKKKRSIQVDHSTILGASEPMRVTRILLSRACPLVMPVGTLSPIIFTCPLTGILSETHLPPARRPGKTKDGLLPTGMALVWCGSSCTRRASLRSGTSSRRITARRGSSAFSCGAWTCPLRSTAFRRISS